LDAGPFIAEIKALIGSNTSLNADDKPAKTFDDKPAKKGTAKDVKKNISSKKALDQETGEKNSPP
jgi:hypothetical protein